MAISHAFLDAVRTAVKLTPEYTAYNAAIADLDAASELDRLAKWQLAYGTQAGGSKDLRLKQAIRQTLLDRDTSALSQLEREDAYRQIAAGFIRDDDRPLTIAERSAVARELAAQGD